MAQAQASREPVVVLGLGAMGRALAAGVVRAGIPTVVTRALEQQPTR
jgi:3-hydroxyisobutyrate dehydrogenase-like beta-hydroxyacid dehydrogenase